MTVIDNFSEEYRWLSNFWMCPVEFENIIYQSNEHAYQASKTIIISERYDLKENCPTAGKAKRYGKKVTKRSDWLDVKIDNMYVINLEKFTCNFHLRNKLLSTGNAEIVEGNNWGDVFWGICDGVGENNLGKVIMKIRSELQNKENNNDN